MLVAKTNSSSHETLLRRHQIDSKAFDFELEVKDVFKTAFFLETERLR